MALDLTFDHVSLSYASANGPVEALRDVSFRVQRGEFAALVGPSGCGKSTLLKLATGLLLPTSGTVTALGQSVSGPVANAGMAFQNSNLLPWRNVLDNVTLPLEVTKEHRQRYRTDPQACQRDAMDMLALVGLCGFEQRFVWELSGGMQQRVSLCRALIHRPKLLMLDEPFGALDMFTREDLWCVLRDLRREVGCTILHVTHDLREAVFLADNVHVMSHRPARIVASKAIGLPAGRQLDETYTPAFTALVHDIRAHIGQQRP